MRNTKHSGMVTFFIYQHKGGYQGVCLELNIIEEGKSQDAVIGQLDEHVKAYIEYVCQHGHCDELLNRPAPKKYWDRFKKYVSSLSGCGARHAAAGVRKRSSTARFPAIPSAMIMTTSIPAHA